MFPLAGLATFYAGLKRYSQINSLAKAKVSRANSNRRTPVSLEFVLAEIINSLAEEVKGALTN